MLLGKIPRRGNAMQTKSKNDGAVAGRYRAGPGLYKQIAASGSGSWVLRYEMAGRKRWMGLGPLAIFSTKEAMARAREAQQLIYSGVDPIDARRNQRAVEVRKAILSVTFEAAAKAFYAQHECKWGHKSRTAFLNTMGTYAYPVLGKLPVDQVDAAMVLRVIEPIWLSKHVTAGRVLGRIEAVLDWATVRGYRAGDNPARWDGHLDQLLPTGGDIGKVVHHAAMDYRAVPAFIAALQQRGGVGHLALEFTILTASRTNEVLKARWSEVDFDTRVWTRPANHMKAKIEHAVPLTPRMLEILKSLPREGGDGPIFVGAQAGQLLGKNAMPKLLTSLVGAGCTVHGFRSSFKDWCSEQTNYPRELAEHALAHAVGNKVELAYSRSKLIEKRRQLMAQWERFIATPAILKSGTVTPIRKAQK
jgi:integrase